MEESVPAVPAERANKQEKAGANPFTDAITLTMPSIRIDMVEATNLRNYEVWFLISTIAASFASAFFSLYWQTQEGSVLLLTVFMSVVVVIATAMTAAARIQISRESRKYRLRTNGVEEIQSEKESH